MTAFLRLLAEKDKASGLLDTCTALRVGSPDIRVFQVEPELLPRPGPVCVLGK